MKINISKKQYEVLIKALEMSSFIYGPLSDMVDKKFKKDSDEIESLEKYFLTYAKDFHFEKNLCSPDELHLDEDYYMKILDDLEQYDDRQLFDNLANELAKRDFRNKYSKKEIEALHKEHGDYLGVPMYDFEKKYYDEFNDKGYDRLFIKE